MIALVREVINDGICHGIKWCLIGFVGVFLAEGSVSTCTCPVSDTCEAGLPCRCSVGIVVYQRGGRSAHIFRAGFCAGNAKGSKIYRYVAFCVSGAWIRLSRRNRSRRSELVDHPRGRAYAFRRCCPLRPPRFKRHPP